MSNADRIEELRTKYEENPRRYFAPLANEFRKAGDLAQAIAICREHLPKQPGHMSGYIVFGQTLFEANSLDEARTVFEQALALDPENLIALKHLGDIARMNGENSVARRWYARVLDADPRNDDIASQLASLAPTPVVPIAAIVPAPAEDEVLDEKPGVFATFDPSSLLEVPDDVIGALGEGAEGDASASAAPEGATAAAPQAFAHAEVPEYGDAEQPAERAAAEARFDARHEPLDLDFPDSPEPASEEFEEGILAPQWPDTSGLVARIVTPVRSATPLSVPATPEAMAAFGRESSDPAEHGEVDLRVSDELVDAFLPLDPPAQPAAGQPEEFLATSDASTEDHVEPVSFIAELEAAEFESAEFDASTFEMQEFDVPLAEVEHEIPVTAQVHDEPLVELNDAPMPWELAAGSSLTDSVQMNSDAEQPVAVDAAVEADEADEAMESEEAPVVATDDSADDSESTVDLDVTAEYAIPVLLSADADSDAVAESESVNELSIETTAELPAVAIPEESYAELSSELESERVEAQAAVEAGPGAVSEQVPVVQAEAAPLASGESEKTGTFVTETMAELLVSQGFVSRAIEVYDELVRRRPHDPVLVARLEELRTTEREALQRADELIAQQPSLETPALGSPAVTPLYSTPLRATPVFTPQHATASGGFSAQANAQQAFRTARERFAELASRRVARRTPTHATAVSDDQADGLSALFGTSQPTTTDELAARALADAFGPVQDSGESLFDPAPMPTPAGPLRALTPRHNTPVQSPSQANPDHRSDRQPATDYSFDKFFPDPAMTSRDAQSVHSTATATQDTSQPVNEDLAQFSAWLKGLNNA